MLLSCMALEDDMDGKDTRKVACVTWLVSIVRSTEKGKGIILQVLFCERETETTNHLIIHCRVTLKLLHVVF